MAYFLGPPCRIHKVKGTVNSLCWYLGVLLMICCASTVKHIDFPNTLSNFGTESHCTHRPSSKKPQRAERYRPYTLQQMREAENARHNACGSLRLSTRLQWKLFLTWEVLRWPASVSTYKVCTTKKSHAVTTGSLANKNRPIIMCTPANKM